MENLQAEISSNLSLKRELEQFLESPGWARVQGIVQQQVDALQREVLFTPCSSVDSAFSQEYKKGQIEGRLSISTVVEAEIEMCEMNLLNLRRLENAERTDDGNSETSGGPRSAP
jgi:hypothetical protein